MSNYPVPEASKDTARSYGGIVEALKKLRASIGAPERNFPHNFQGIIEAILSLTKYGGSAEGEFPPNWEIITDDDGNIIGGDYDPPLQNGRLWFDERCGRLFVWVDDGWYQTNGADGLAKVQDTVPNEQVNGSFWFNTANDTLYVYDGDSDAWTVVGGSGTINTQTLPLASPTRQLFDLTQGATILPDPSGKVVQADANQWFVDSLNALEAAIDNIVFPKPLHVGVAGPVNPEEGDLWYDTVKLELLAFYDKTWVPTALPFIEQDLIFYDNSISALNSGLGRAEGDISALHALVNAIPERKTYSIGTNKDTAIHFGQPDGIYLLDNSNNYHGIGITGDNGISVYSTSTAINISGTALQDEITRVENNSATVSALATTNATAAALSSDIDGLDMAIGNLENSHLLIADTVDALPTFADLETKLDVAGGAISGDIDMYNNNISNLAAPLAANDAARKVDIDVLEQHVQQNYINKSEAIMKELIIRKEDTDKASIDLSENVAFSNKALRFATNGGINNKVTFGTTDNPYEYAWEFNSNENFAWHHSNGYVFALDKDGAYATNLYVGTFNTPTNNGLAITNKINVGTSLTNTSSALAALKQAVASSTDFADFKVKALTALNNF